jgi:hypothetical protein
VTGMLSLQQANLPEKPRESRRDASEDRQPARS